MKRFNYKKLLSMLAIIMIVESGAAVVYHAARDTGSYTNDEGIAPCSDRPPENDLKD